MTSREAVCSCGQLRITAEGDVPLGGFADPSFPAPTRSIYESRMHPWAAVPTATEHDPP